MTLKENPSDLMVRVLARDTDLHKAGQYEQIGLDFDLIDKDRRINPWPGSSALCIAWNFWDGWIDARNHDWMYYEGIEKKDWPVLAQEIAKNLQDDSEIVNPVLIKYFDLTKSDKNFFDRIKDFITKVV